MVFGEGGGVGVALVMWEGEVNRYLYIYITSHTLISTECPPRVFDPCIFQSHNRDECLEDFHCKRGQVCCPRKCALECVDKQW